MTKSSIYFLIVLFSITNCFSQSKNNSALELKKDTTPIVNAKSLYPFYKKLTNQNTELIRVVHWGDSHIQMGYMSEEIRYRIDSTFKLNGFGSIFPYKAANYNPNYSYTRIKNGKWIGGNIMKDSLSVSSGFMGFWTKTYDSTAAIQFGISKTPLFQDGNTHITIFYTSDADTKVEFSGANLKKDSTLFFNAIYSTIEYSKDQKWKVCKLIFDQEVSTIEVKIENNIGPNGVNIHGAVFEKSWDKGVTYNSCGVGGAQIKHLNQNTNTLINQISYLNTNLIIISFGSNESYTPQFDSVLYRNGVIQLVDEIRKEIPGVCILFTGPPDTRSKNRFPRNTSAICSIFKELSIEKGFAYWDVRSAMGGEGSIQVWLSKGLASTDKLHFTKKGYALHGKWLFNAIHREYEKYLQIATYEK